MSHRPSLVLAASALAALAACESALAPASEGDIEHVVERFEVVQRTEAWSPFPIAYLETDLALVNVSGRPVGIQYGGCVLELEAEVGSSGRTWRSVAHQGWPSSTSIGCLLVLYGARVAPGDTLRGPFGSRIRLADILADSLPAGQYGFSAHVRLMGMARRLDLGQIHLPVSHHPLPEQLVSRDGFDYEVSVGQEALAAGGEISISLSVGHSPSAGSQRLERLLSASCPVRILAYSDSSDQITIPMPEATWTWPTTCDAGDQMVRLGPGDSAGFETLIDPEDVAASEGTYFLVAVVDVDGRPLRILAGEVVLP